MSQTVERLRHMKSRIAIIAIIAAVFILGIPYAKYRRETALINETEAVQSITDEDALLPDSPAPEETVAEDAEPDADEVEQNADTQDAVSKEADEEPADEPEDKPEDKPILPEYNELLKVNPYVAGWLEIDGSVINDPVVYTPGSQNYFLHRSIDGSNESRGTLFIAINWWDGNNNTLIYGHNMKDGSGFGSLSKFAKESYGLQHPLIRFDTLYEKREYELYAAFYSQIEEEELETEEDRDTKDKKIEEEAVAKKEEEGQIVAPAELTLNDIDLHRDFGDADIYRAEKDEDNGRFRYYYYTDLSNRDDFEYFARNVKERALYDTGVEAEWGDEFITLSTCSYQVKNGRFIVVGVRKK